VSVLETDETTSLSVFDHWRQKPHHNSGPQIRLMLERLSALRHSQLHQVNVSSVSPNRVQLLADFALATPSSRLRRLPLERQVAVLVAGLVTLNMRLQDLILEMVDQWLSDLLRRAQFRFEQARLQSLAAFDQAAFQLRDLAQFLDDLPEEHTLLVADLFSQFPRTTIQAAIALISQVQQPEHHRYQALALSHYRSARRFLPLLWPLMAFRARSMPSAVLEAITFLHRLDGPKPPSRQEAPRAVISPRWRPLVFDTRGTLQLNAYTFCVLQSLFQYLRRREIYIMPSERWNDPRQSLIDPTQWPHLRPHICRLLDRHPSPQPEFEVLSRQLDDAYRHMNTALRSAPHLRMEIIEGVSRPISTPLEAVPETPNLQRLRQTLTQRLPQVDLPDLMLEVHHLTGFADAFSHLREKQARASDLPISLCAVLLAEACNIGLEAVADDSQSALSLQRLAWVQHNYMRPDTLAEANRWLVTAQSHLRLAQVWGGGDVASADGLRFVVPQRCCVY